VSGGALGPLKNFMRRRKDPDPWVPLTNGSGSPTQHGFYVTSDFFSGGLLIAGLGVSGGALGPLKNFMRKGKDLDPEQDPYL
jgi:hypothetical protein